MLQSIRITAGTVMYDEDRNVEASSPWSFDIQAVLKACTNEFRFSYLGHHFSVAANAVEVRTTITCPGCNISEVTPFALTSGVYRCNECKAVFGECSYMDSLRYVLNRWGDGQIHVAPVDRVRFDFQGLDEYGQAYHRRGWFDAKTRRIVE